MPDLPIACTLEAATLAEHGDALLPGLARRATGLCWQPDGVRLIFGLEKPLLTEIATVITAERQCCRFLTFQLTVQAGDAAVTLDVTGPDGTVEFLARLLD